MYDDILKAIQDRVQGRHYVMTVHAEEEMDDDAMTIFDVEAAIETGIIVARQRDRERGEWKYVIEGWIGGGQRAAVVAKVGPMATVVIITVYRL